ncbi:hypothetical protein ACOMHN_021247 [Nucella lapillus]
MDPKDIYYDSGNEKGNNSGEFEKGDVPGAELPERADVHKPGTKLRSVLPYVDAANVDTDVYDDTISSRVRSPVKITSL